MPGNETVRTTNRRRFLREALVTLGAGLGVILIPATAYAAGTKCCKDSTCPKCSNHSKAKYRCSSTCPGGPNGCRCYTPTQNKCFTAGC